MGEAFDLLAAESNIPNALAKRMRGAFSFRNIAVHSRQRRNKTEAVREALQNEPERERAKPSAADLAVRFSRALRGAVAHTRGIPKTGLL
jgi:hypothetical protein